MQHTQEEKDSLKKENSHRKKDIRIRRYIEPTRRNNKDKKKTTAGNIYATSVYTQDICWTNGRQVNSVNGEKFIKLKGVNKP